MQKLSLTWQNPLELAQKIAQNYEKDWIFLYSANEKEEHSLSYIAIFPKNEVKTDNFDDFEQFLQQNRNSFANFGYISYEIAQKFEKLPKTQPSFIDLPQIHFINFGLVLEFDHKNGILTAFCDKNEQINEVFGYKSKNLVKNNAKIDEIHSNFTDEEYKNEISDIRQKIADGDFYQTNLTRKFYGKFTKNLTKEENFAIFHDLITKKAGNYASFLSFGENFVISSSPELFLEVQNFEMGVEKERQIISRPIKGTMPRGENDEEDQKNIETLKNSAKDQAENLMIVDLVRNDLARICESGSVFTKDICKLTSYANVHHLSSEIHGIIDEKFSNCDAIRACFPPGSMTGAPKIKAMETAAEKEKINRGIYSGAIGMASFDDAMKLSVVIRTLITNGDKFEFQSGGAITFDSDPQKELEEIYAKISVIQKVIGMSY